MPLAALALKQQVFDEAGQLTPRAGASASH